MFRIGNIYNSGDISHGAIIPKIAAGMARIIGPVVMGYGSAGK